MNTEYFKQKLEEERGVVEGQLKELGRENPSVPGDWDATGGSLETMSPIQDSNEAADKLEEYGERREETNQLEIRLREINEALGKIEKGTYGVGEVCGEPIGEDRLEANPAARTCKEHM
ncbi:hypothetical protein A3B33_01880 [Candidatus Adlerbacteria bacterium RIFCSPLOWO2_01_FULL_54_16]|uniref:Zinc finger DksA/TraR C4-type domain-containing protein n=1 Tax=Candidatus Adlerbacteria bacterium RIFCSPLOWO2_01_FULL_54_16 TaxID=1797244 RepID=A0A1F4Y0R1_9BACT|nr:MAG: hypothetical protein A3B33_01880 [Candidatus Adlerbacteria bacterium RIFCSPLOWO2_01_FULL_54_16]